MHDMSQDLDRILISEKEMDELITKVAEEIERGSDFHNRAALNALCHSSAVLKHCAFRSAAAVTVTEGAKVILAEVFL